MNWRPNKKAWDKVNPKPIGVSMTCAFNREDMYEHGEKCADAMYEAIMKARPSDSEIRIRIIEALYGGTSVPELERWLKEKLLLKP